MDDYNRRPYIGMCYYHKLKGIVLDRHKMARRRARKPCIGMCYRKKKRKEKERRDALKVLRKEKKKKSEVSTI